MKKLSELKKAAQIFSKKWSKGGHEMSDYQSFVEDLLEDVFGVDRARDQIAAQMPVKVGFKTKKSDIYVKLSKTIIEMKSSNVSLDEPEKQSDGEMLTPLEQGKRYYDWLNKQDQGNYIIACNFKEFQIFDNHNKQAKPLIIKLEDLPNKISQLKFLVIPDDKMFNGQEEPISRKASQYVRTLYQLLKKANPNPDKAMLHNMNVFCVRVVFCLYADDAGMFDNAQFHNFVYTCYEKRLNLQEQFDILFNWLDDKTRIDKYLTAEIKAFPYVDGGLFKKDSNYNTPNLTEEIIKHLVSAWNLKLDDGKEFHWGDISPTNFGCIFESTVDETVREQGGMHYTTPSNIHKLIDSLFLNDYKEELKSLKAMPGNTRQDKLAVTERVENFRNDISKLIFLDPACGSGNFLTESYKSLYSLELEAIEKELKDGNFNLPTTNIDPCKVSINQFYGIEIEDFAAQVARAALWIAECQMRQKSREVLNFTIETLPLNKNANIVVGDALTTDWLSVFRPKIKNSSKLYIIGNPPFQGGKKKDKAQQKSQELAMPSVINGTKVWSNQGSLDFVGAWYAKAAQVIEEHHETRVAFVSTNSIMQGEQNAPLWEPLLKHYKLHIDFAWRSFRWFNEADVMAHVHCVIVAFSRKATKERLIFDGDKEPIAAKNINNYLLAAENIFIWNRSKPLYNVPEIGIGNKPIDGGFYLFTEEGKDAFIKQEPASSKYFHPYYGATEFIRRKPRWCLWLGDCSSSELAALPECCKRIEAVRDYRLSRGYKQNDRLITMPAHFHVEFHPKSSYLLIPRHSSENRDIIPMGFMSPNDMASDAVLVAEGIEKWQFGVLQSRIHMAWVNIVCGRIKSDFRYSEGIVYNCFPWPTAITDEQKNRLTATAQEILDARNADPNATLADYYDKHSLRMSECLRKAHNDNDKAVAEAFGLSLDSSDEDIALELMRRSQKRVASLLKKKKSKKRKR